MRQQVILTRRKRAKGTPKASTVAIYASIFALIVTIVAVGYQTPQQTSGIASSVTPTSESLSQKTSVNEVVATDIAANLAKTVNLSVANNVAQLAVSTATLSELNQIDNSVVAKPQIIDPASNSRTVVSHTVKAGETIDSLATNYGITADTIKWANNLTSNTVAEGKVLKIPPTDGVLYTVKEGDTVTSIAKKYNADEARIVLYNDLDVAGIVAGQQIILPSGNLPNNERPGYVAPVTTYYNTYYTGYSAGFSGKTWRIRIGTPGYAGNTYAFGNCTKYVYDRRTEMGLAVSASWGNAGTWAMLAKSQNGLIVDRTPSVGAIIQDSGHVAIVEELLPNGDLRISEMNAYVSGGGFNIVSGRIVSSAYIGQYYYIH